MSSSFSPQIIAQQELQSQDIGIMFISYKSSYHLQPIRVSFDPHLIKLLQFEMNEKDAIELNENVLIASFYINHFFIKLNIRLIYLCN